MKTALINITGLVAQQQLLLHSIIIIMRVASKLVANIQFWWITRPVVDSQENNQYENTGTMLV